MKLTAAWNRFWFESIPLQRLAIFRILFCVLALFDVSQYGGAMILDAEAAASGAANSPWRPMFVFEVLGIGPATPAIAKLVSDILVTSLFLLMFGALTRTVACIVAVLTFYVTCQVYSFNSPHHDKVAYAFAALGLAISPCGARWSVDAWWRGRRGREAMAVWAAAVPLRLTQVTIAIGYTFAGWAKVRDPEWLNGYTLQGHMMGHNNVFAETLSNTLLLAQVSGAIAVLTELTFFVPVFFRATRWVYLPAAVSFHLGTWATMDTGPYITLWFLLIAFIELERVPDWVCTGLGRGGWSRLRVALVIVPAVALPLYVFLRRLPGYYTPLFGALACLGTILWLRDRRQGNSDVVAG